MSWRASSSEVTRSTYGAAASRHSVAFEFLAGMASDQLLGITVPAGREQVIPIPLTELVLETGGIRYRGFQVVMLGTLSKSSSLVARFFNS